MHLSRRFIVLLFFFFLLFFLLFFFLPFFFLSYKKSIGEIIITSFSFVVVFPFLSTGMGMRILFDISYNILD